MKVVVLLVILVTAYQWICATAIPTSNAISDPCDRPEQNQPAEKVERPSRNVLTEITDKVSNAGKYVGKKLHIIKREATSVHNAAADKSDLLRQHESNVSPKGPEKVNARTKRNQNGSDESKKVIKQFKEPLRNLTGATIRTQDSPAIAAGPQRASKKTRRHSIQPLEEKEINAAANSARNANISVSLFRELHYTDGIQTESNKRNESFSGEDKVEAFKIRSLIRENRNTLPGNSTSLKSHNLTKRSDKDKATTIATSLEDNRNITQNPKTSLLSESQIMKIPKNIKRASNESEVNTDKGSNIVRVPRETLLANTTDQSLHKVTKRNVHPTAPINATIKRTRRASNLSEVETENKTSNLVRVPRETLPEEATNFNTHNVTKRNVSHNVHPNAPINATIERTKRSSNTSEVETNKTSNLVRVPRETLPEEATNHSLHNVTKRNVSHNVHPTAPINATIERTKRSSNTSEVETNKTSNLVRVPRETLPEEAKNHSLHNVTKRRVSDHVHPIKPKNVSSIERTKRATNESELGMNKTSNLARVPRQTAPESSTNDNLHNVTQRGISDDVHPTTANESLTENATLSVVPLAESQIGETPKNASVNRKKRTLNETEAETNKTSTLVRMLRDTFIESSTNHSLHNVTKRSVSDNNQTNANVTPNLNSSVSLFGKVQEVPKNLSVERVKRASNESETETNNTTSLTLGSRDTVTQNSTNNNLHNVTKREVFNQPIANTTLLHQNVTQAANASVSLLREPQDIKAPKNETDERVKRTTNEREAETIKTINLIRLSRHALGKNSSKHNIIKRGVPEHVQPATNITQIPKDAPSSFSQSEVSAVPKNESTERLKRTSNETAAETINPIRMLRETVTENSTNLNLHNITKRQVPVTTDQQENNATDAILNFRESSKAKNATTRTSQKPKSPITHHHHKKSKREASEDMNDKKKRCCNKTIRAAAEDDSDGTTKYKETNETKVEKAGRKLLGINMDNEWTINTASSVATTEKAKADHHGDSSRQCTCLMAYEDRQPTITECSVPSLTEATWEKQCSKACSELTKVYYSTKQMVFCSHIDNFLGFGAHAYSSDVIKRDAIYCQIVPNNVEEPLHHLISWMHIIFLDIVVCLTIIAVICFYMLCLVCFRRRREYTEEWSGTAYITTNTTPSRAKK